MHYTIYGVAQDYVEVMNANKNIYGVVVLLIIITDTNTNTQKKVHLKA